MLTLLNRPSLPRIDTVRSGSTFTTSEPCGIPQAAGAVAAVAGAGPVPASCAGATAAAAAVQVPFNAGSSLGRAHTGRPHTPR